MADEPAVIDEPKVEPKAEKTEAPKFDTKRSLSEQSKEIAAKVEALPEDKTGDKPKEEAKGDTATKEDEVVTPPAVDDDEEEELEVPAPTTVEGTWQDYVYKNLKPISTRILDTKGNAKTVTIKTPQELPDGFKFADDASAAKFSTDITQQTIDADKLKNEFDQKQAAENYRQFEEQEAKDIAEDLKDLQKEGIIPKFKYKEDDDKFNDDPAVKEANAIYDLYKKTNAAYMKKYMGTNRTFRVSYRDAADKYYAAQARAKRQETPIDTKKADNQKAREEVSKKVGAPTSGEPGTTRPKPTPGMSFDDIRRLANTGRI